MRSLNHLFLELKNFYCFFKLDKSERNIVFYSEREGYYPFFEGLINQLVHKKGQPIVYITSDLKDSILNSSENNIKAFYFKKLLPFFFSIVDCKAFIMTLTDLGYHLKRSKHNVHYIYLFHSLASTHMAFRAGSFDKYDTIFCPGPRHSAEIEKYEQLNNLKKKNLFKYGDYRLERLIEEFKNFNPSKGINGTKGIILISPSWGDKNILETCGKDLINLLLENNFYIILRPHSEIVKRNSKLIDEYKFLFSSNKNFEMDILPKTFISLLRADILISDYSGIVFPFAFGTLRPVIFIDTPPKIKNYNYKDLNLEPLEIELREKIGVIVDPNNLKEIITKINFLFSNRDSFKKNCLDLREKYIYNVGFSTEVGVEYILNLLNNC
jgi:YidC/Oxa1 family membrane protein insertase